MREYWKYGVFGFWKRGKGRKRKGKKGIRKNGIVGTEKRRNNGMLE